MRSEITNQTEYGRRLDEREAQPGTASRPLRDPDTKPNGQGASLKVYERLAKSPDMHGTDPKLTATPEGDPQATAESLKSPVNQPVPSAQQQAQVTAAMSSAPVNSK